MRRADRLFQIIQVLRRTRKPLTADAIAAELETSKRTIYRDIATLIGQRVPIRGEAGMGYILEKGFDLPPLMLTPDEIEAAVLGAQWVSGHADEALARAAQDLIAKIADTVPEHLRPFVLEPASRARPVWRRRARPHRHGADAGADSRGQENHAALPRRARPRQRAHDLADRHGLSSKRCGCWRPGASCARISAVFAPTGWSMRLSRRKISGTARHPAGAMAQSLVWEQPGDN